MRCGIAYELTDPEGATLSLDGLDRRLRALHKTFTNTMDLDRVNVSKELAAKVLQAKEDLTLHLKCNTYGSADTTERLARMHNDIMDVQDRTLTIQLELAKMRWELDEHYRLLGLFLGRTLPKLQVPTTIAPPPPPRSRNSSEPRATSQTKKK